MSEPEILPPRPPGIAPFPVATDRVLAVATLILAGVVLWHLGGADPDPRGHGTHEQFGLEPCSWPRSIGKPCPTCGATTAATWVVHGRPDKALAINAFGGAVAVIGLIGTWHAAWSLIRRDLYGQRLSRLPLRWICVGLTAVLFLSWGWNWVTWES